MNLQALKRLFNAELFIILKSGEILLVAVIDVGGF